MNLDEKNQSKFSFYPNPASDKILVESHVDSDIKLIIYDYFGNLQYSTILPKRLFVKINTIEWSRGLFFVKVEIDGKIETKKLILH